MGENFVNLTCRLRYFSHNRIAPLPVGIVQSNPKESTAVASEVTIIDGLEVSHYLHCLGGIDVGASTRAIGDAVAEYNLYQIFTEKEREIFISSVLMCLRQVNSSDSSSPYWVRCRKGHSINCQT